MFSLAPIDIGRILSLHTTLFHAPLIRHLELDNYDWLRIFTTVDRLKMFTGLQHLHLQCPIEGSHPGTTGDIIFPYVPGGSLSVRDGFGFATLDKLFHAIPGNATISASRRSEGRPEDIASDPPVLRYQKRRS